MKEKGNAAYEVGYGKPPKHTRYRKGASGNPAGRPKGQRNLATILAHALEEQIVIDVRHPYRQNAICNDKTDAFICAPIEEVMNDPRVSVMQRPLRAFSREQATNCLGLRR